MNLDRLALRAIYLFLEENNKKIIPWKDVVKSCFRFFPDEFRFEEENWPDTEKIHNCIRWRCINDRHWVMGDTKTGFFLTEIGRSMGEVNLENKKYEDVTKRKTESTLDGKLIKFVKENSLYKKYKKEKSFFRPSESEIRSLLKTTMETDIKTLERNMEYLKKVIKDYQENDLINFSEVIGKKVKELKEDE